VLRGYGVEVFALCIGLCIYLLNGLVCSSRFGPSAAWPLLARWVFLLGALSLDGGAQLVCRVLPSLAFFLRHFRVLIFIGLGLIWQVFLLVFLWVSHGCYMTLCKCVEVMITSVVLFVDCGLIFIQLCMSETQNRLFGPGRGGVRKGAGRKRRVGKGGVSHGRRARVTRHDPVHVTQGLDCAGRRLRTKQARRVLVQCFEAGGERFGFRLVEYSIQSNHLHFIVEADDSRALARGMQGLKIRIARALNRLWGLRGPRFLDRYHCHVLRTLREVRNALLYVLNNARRHGCRLVGIDGYSSGASFGGWVGRSEALGAMKKAWGHARSWKLRIGWLRYGRLSPQAKPGA
jgi:putative transposase